VIDWLPTLAELGGVSECDVPGNIDGKSLVNLWTNGEDDNYWRTLLVDVDPECGSRRRQGGEGAEEGSQDRDNEKESRDEEEKEESEEKDEGGDGKGGDSGPTAALRYGPYKLTSSCVDYYGQFSDQYFYNLEDDLNETTNLLDSGLSDDEEDIFYLMVSALSMFAQEAYPTDPDWNEGVYYPDLEQNCGYGYVDGMDTVRPWSNCSQYSVGNNSFENSTWKCVSYCTDAVGGAMPSEGIKSNRAEGTNTCPAQSPSVAPSAGSTSSPYVVPTQQPSLDPASSQNVTGSISETLGMSAGSEHKFLFMWFLLPVLTIPSIVLLLLWWLKKGQSTEKHIKLKKYDSAAEITSINRTVINDSKKNATSEHLETQISKDNHLNKIKGIHKRRATPYVTLMASKADKYGSVERM